jgi:Mn2+/Fe2+ NRAMP family transporter
MKIGSVWKEVTSMLYWSMLAACTVGPGTVVTCARAGAEYGYNLIWTLIFASVLAYTLQEGTARLTIVSGKSLGQCLRVKYRHGPKIYGTAVICWLVAISVFIGNTLYECNNWAGGIDAVFAIPDQYWPYITDEGWNGVGWRVGFCILYGVVVLLLLYWDKVDLLGMLLGFVMMSMVALFLVVVCYMTIPLNKLGWGFLPNIPDKKEGAAEPTDIILSLVGTTSIGFNLFLGGSMAKGRKLGTAQRGIAFSTISALEVSVLILIVGAGTFSDADSGTREFSVDKLADLIQSVINVVGVYIFAFGFIAAALSSMLAVPLGAALTADSVFCQCEEEKENGGGAENPAFAELKDIEAQQGASSGETKEKSEPIETPASPTKLVTKQEQDNVEATITTEDQPVLKTLPRSIYLAIMTVMVVIAVTVIACNVPRVHVILVAQVFNGCLLPFFAICLLMCLNDDQFMNKSPQKGWANIFLFVSVTITVFLTSNVLIQKILGSLIPVTYKLIISLCVAIVAMGSLSFFTSLGRDLVRSFASWRKI